MAEVLKFKHACSSKKDSMLSGLPDNTHTQ